MFRRGGQSRTIWKRYSVLEKLQLLGECSRLQREANLLSARAALFSFDGERTWISRACVDRRCQRGVYIWDQMALSCEFRTSCTSGSSQKASRGLWLWRAILSTRPLLSSMLPVDSRKRHPFQVVSGWLKRYLYVYCMQTNEATRPPHIVQAEVLDFLVTTRMKLAILTVTSSTY